MGGILSYLQDILGGGDSVLVNKKEWGDSVRGGGGGGGGDFVRIPDKSSHILFNELLSFVFH